MFLSNVTEFAITFPETSKSTGFDPWPLSITTLVEFTSSFAPGVPLSITEMEACPCSAAKTLSLVEPSVYAIVIESFASREKVLLKVTTGSPLTSIVLLKDQLSLEFK